MHPFFSPVTYDLFLFQALIHTVSAHDTHSLKPWDSQFQYMKRRVSIHGTQGFNIWNAQSQAMEGEKESTKMLDFPICYVCEVTSLLVPLHSF